MIHPTAVVGDPPESRVLWADPTLPTYPPHIEPSARVHAFVTVDAGLRAATYIGKRTALMAHTHVGHDARIGDDCELASGSIVGGHVTIGDRVRVGIGATFKPFVTIGNGARIGCGSNVIRDVPPGEVWAGNPARCIHKTQEPPMTEAEAEGWDALVAERDPSEVYL